jgi:2-polyprenyl-3-methyl-5-hydroxy-6-metoxy-1,4-benzoquinol methylase
VKEYPGEFADDGAHGHGFELLARSARERGLVIDLGCATGPLAEPVTSLGFDYLGADIDTTALAGLAARGFEARQLDLRLDEEALVDALSALAGGRDVAAVLLLDVVEHLVDPGPTLRAIARLGAPGSPPPDLIVSVPNVAHVDLGAKLLVGRWDLTKIGLLDDTHLRFFTDRRLRDVMATAGWTETDAYDVVNPYSDQMFPVDAPVLRPGTPLRQLLSRLRTNADPFGETYQHVRRFEHDASRLVPLDAADDSAVELSVPFLTICVRLTGTTDGSVVANDLAGQTDRDFEVVVSRDPRADDFAGGPDLAGIGVHVFRLGDVADWRNAAVEAANGRYVAFLDDRTRVAPRYVEAIRGAGEKLPARVVQTSVYQHDSVGPEPFDDLVVDLPTVDLDPLDLASSRPFGSVVLTAYAVPREACATVGLRFPMPSASGSIAVFLLRAVEMCGIVRSDEAVTAVGPGAVRDLAADLAYVQDELGRTPMVIPEGAASYILHMRETLAAVVPERDRLAGQLAATKEHVSSLTSLIRQRENEVAAAMAEADAARLARERRLSTKLRRRVGRLARSI